MQKFRHILLVLLILGCNDDEPIIRDFPIIKTLSPTDIDESGATFHGELVRKGKTKITSYGFVWKLDDPGIIEMHKVDLGKNLSDDLFEARVDHSLIKGLTYQVRAFVELLNQTIFGEIVFVESQGSTNGARSLELTDRVNFQSPDFRR